MSIYEISFVVLHHQLIYNPPLQNRFLMTIEGPLIRYIGERKYTVDRIVPLFKAIESVYREYIFDWIEVQANCIRDAKKLFPEFDLTLNKVDGIGSAIRKLYLSKCPEDRRIPF